jgi:hypothetical protein
MHHPGEHKRKSKKTKNPIKEGGSNKRGRGGEGRGGRGQSQQGRAQGWALPILICVWSTGGGVVRSLKSVSTLDSPTATKAPFFNALLILMVLAWECIISALP